MPSAFPADVRVHWQDLYRRKFSGALRTDPIAAKSLLIVGPFLLVASMKRVEIANRIAPEHLTTAGGFWHRQFKTPVRFF